MKIDVKPINFTPKELAVKVGNPCELAFDNKGFIFTTARNGYKGLVVAELHCNKKDAEQLINQINSYDCMLETLIGISDYLINVECECGCGPDESNIQCVKCAVLEWIEGALPNGETA